MSATISLQFTPPRSTLQHDLPFSLSSALFFSPQLSLLYSAGIFSTSIARYETFPPRITVPSRPVANCQQFLLKVPGVNWLMDGLPTMVRVGRSESGTRIDRIYLSASLAPSISAMLVCASPRTDPEAVKLLHGSPFHPPSCTQQVAHRPPLRIAGSQYADDVTVYSTSGVRG